MIWIEEKNGADNPAMFQLVLSSTAQGQGHSSSSYCPASEGLGDEELGEDRTGTNNPEWPKGIFCAICSCAEQQNWGSWPWGCWLGTDQWVVSNCIVHHFLWALFVVIRVLVCAVGLFFPLSSFSVY